MAITKLTQPRFTRAFLQRQPSQGYLAGSNLHSALSVPLKVVVLADVGTTTLSDPVLAGYGTDYFKNWVIQFQANSMNAGSSNEVVGDTALVSASTNVGKLTFAATLTGATKVGDEFYLIPPYVWRQIGAPIAFSGVKTVAVGSSGVAGARTGGGTALTGAVAGGDILVDRIIAQIHGTAPTGAFTGLYVRNASLTKLNVAFRNRDGTLFIAAQAIAGGIGIAECGHIITTADVLTLYTEPAVAITGTGPTFTFIGRALSNTASLAIA